jgi:peptidoglycan hydrolase-like protein with peptidoglycan-binding domain
MTNKNNTPSEEAPETPVEAVEAVEVVVTSSEPSGSVVEAVKAPKAPKILVTAKGSVPIPAALAVTRPAPAGPAVVSDKAQDDVLLSACVYKNEYARKSLTVHHLQRRLNELGYAEAFADRDGYYGDLTKMAVARFQKDSAIEGDGMIDAPTFLAVFTGDPNVKPII